jgi:hypothetical protein
MLVTLGATAAPAASQCSPLTGAPEDREPVVRKLIESAGGKVISYYVTTGGLDEITCKPSTRYQSAIEQRLHFEIQLSDWYDHGDKCPRDVSSLFGNFGFYIL